MKVFSEEEMTLLKEDLIEFKQLIDNFPCRQPQEGDYAEFVDESDPENSPVRICDKNGHLLYWFPDFETYDDIRKWGEENLKIEKEIK